MTQSPQTDQVTIYSPQGEAVEVTRLNALDLTRHNAFTWNANTKTQTETAEPPIVVAETEIDLPEVVEDSTQEAPSLDVEAKLVGDYDNIEDYLNTMDSEALRTMIEEKFGERVHARTGKSKIIARYIELNDAADAGDDEED